MPEPSGSIARRRGSFAVAVMVLVVYAVSAGQDEAASRPETETRPGSRPVTVTRPKTLPATETRPETLPETQTQPETRPTTRVGFEPGVKAGKPGTFNIHYRDADLRGVLQLLSTQGKRNIIATKEVTGKVTADLYDVTFKQALEAVLTANKYVYYEEDNFIYVCTPEQLQAKKKLSSELIELSYITAADASTMITPLLSKAGTVSTSPAATTGIASSATEAGGNTLSGGDVLLIVDYQEYIDRIKGLLKKLDVKPQQVMIEATILSATIDDADALGVNFNALAGIDFQSLSGTVTSTGTPALTANTINATTLEGEFGGSFRTNEFGALDAAGAGLTVGLLFNRVAMFITALESVTDLTVLANPKLLVLNKQRGEVLIVERQGYETETTTETGTSTKIEFLETGHRLLVRPFICRDGYIRMEIHPEESDGTVTGGIPNETSTEVTSNVLVRDGHTIVIGGLFREESQNSRSQIPIFGNIPYLGTLFRKTSDTMERKEIIILLTPHIVDQAVAEAVGEQVRDDMERYRIGQRGGLQWFARDRLAQSHMRSAKKCLAKGQRSWAIWYLDLALSMSPTMPEALRLRERLSGRACWADEARVSEVQYIIQRMIMHELGKPVDTIVPPRKPLSEEEIDPAVRKVFGIQKRLESPLPPMDLRRKKPKTQLKPKPTVTDEQSNGRPDMSATTPVKRKK